VYYASNLSGVIIILIDAKWKQRVPRPDETGVCVCERAMR